MNPEQTKLLQTLIFLLDKEPKLIIENDLAPYLRKANELKEFMEKL
jgi:hypothetical protein